MMMHHSWENTQRWEFPRRDRKDESLASTTFFSNIATVQTMVSKISTKSIIVESRVFTAIP